jgi:hypothetical protein
MKIRWKCHVGDARRGSKFHFHRAINKYGSDFFQVEILLSGLTSTEAGEAEIRLIREHDSYRNGYNETQGGDIVEWFEKATPEVRSAIIERRRNGFLRYLAARSEEEIQAHRDRTAEQWRNQDPIDRNAMSKKMASRKAKRYRVTSPEGLVTDVLNLKAFCLEMNLNQSHMTGVAKGRLRSYRGWKAEYLD